MKKTIRVCLVLLGILILSYLVFAQQVELIFSHKYHAEQVGAACTDCHPVDQSDAATDNLLPGMDGCYTCHDENETACTLCHKDPDNAIVYPRVTSYIAEFSHSKHTGEKFTCETCHEGIGNSEAVTSETHLPKMDVCMKCHTEMNSTDDCYTCHAKTVDLKPADHELDWNKAHGIAAGIAAENCRTCHTVNACIDCHQKDNLDHKVHRLNFVNNHGIAAKGNKDNCLTCHEEQAFCMDCHRERMVMPRNHAAANWSNSSTGGGHARAARLDLDSCLSCHNDAAGDPVCVPCHH
ncbi:hypothetical protein JW960_05170 [candidate division KSB1 bacterium]|nr:hypothetical protein [candidate division KSB1 bacterium]